MISLNQIVINVYYKKTMMIVCICIALFAGSKSVRGQESREKSSQPTVSAKERFEYFNDFIVYFKNNPEPVCSDEQGTGGNNRLLVCDVVVEMNRGMKLIQERIKLRKIIYKILKEQPGLHKTRKSLKEKIKISLNNLTKVENIKNVYFIRFILL